ncbi:MAG: tRNA (N6-isopentenyl adenosine(37)-C2)-methylthiotransferase MiaB [Gammaproteobacteria bacterium]|nr:tRNA (N6-isopentenyl adenosine(37)-C2)-methylthiotransferase MiaB [Gammaproteobacteria bacterium]MCH9763248.1 tRNA (N6-isopentenyl adenosine(37)-C2)-methylthiotransferase MiaB [Gammaproteobacteria bacterium]
MPKKLFIKTNGCQMNEYDSSKMLDVLRHAHGLEKTDNLLEADVILLNTCSIREKAQEKVFSQLGQWRRYKQSNPHVVIGVGGCVASQEGKDIIKREPLVDLVFGPQTLHRLPEMLETHWKTKKPVVDISFPEIEKFDHLPAPRAEGPVAFVSIMEGCSKYCSYCVVPYTRGEEISRPFDDVLAECYQLAEQGVREINLLGQNVNDYHGPMHDGGMADLALLIQYISAIEGLDRIRFTTSHPLAFTDNLVNAFAEVPELANHLHLPVQSGSDRILGLMKRGYTALEFKSKIRKLRKVRPDIRLSTDIIVGFPGETEQDFEDTLNLVHDIGFDLSFSFIFSARPGTPAANLPDDTPMEIKKQRLKILQDRLLLQATRYSAAMVGSTHRVLVTGPSKKNPEQWAGRTECNRVINFEGPKNLQGQFVEIDVTEAQPNSLRGRLVTESVCA